MQDPYAQTELDFSRDVYTVSRLNREVRAVLEGSFPLLWVEGELSNLRQPGSGHIYFSLKDPVAQVRCAMFRMRRLHLRFQPRDGLQVLVRARVGLYEGRGEFQLVVEHMEPAGEGALRQAIERLKQKLAAEGLFEARRKRPLPPFPRQVGLLTSPSGAAVRDLLSVLRRRFPALPVVIYPAQVQGEEAAGQLVEMLRLANARAECDLLVLARGGGSLEDLAPFNDEALARAVQSSAIPVVTGIGHEIDFTIADLAADRRAATPSAAAELISPDRVELVQRLVALGRRLRAAYRQRLAADSTRFQAVQRHLLLLHPAVRLQQQQQRVDELERRLRLRLRVLLDARGAKLLTLQSRLGAQAPLARLEGLGVRARHLQDGLGRAMQRLLEQRREHLARTVATLEVVSPLATLARGYAIVSLLPQRDILRDAAGAKSGDQVETRLAKGMLVCRVEEVLAE